MKQSRARRGGPLILVAVLAVVLSACTLSGGRTDMVTEDSGSGGGAGDNSGYTIAMITHETPGDTFWDKYQGGRSAGGQ
jgi:simple sugar transport system substrate-binding protein